MSLQYAHKGDALVMEHLTFDSVFLMNQKQIGNDLSLHELVHVLSKALTKVSLK